MTLLLLSRLSLICLSMTASVILVLSSDAAPASASARISPVLIEIGPAGRGALRLTNTRDRSVTYQLTPLDWDVVDGADVQQPTNDFIASPPSFTLKPNQTQEVRLGFRNPRRSPVESSYRLVIEELPSGFESKEQGLTIEVLLRHVLPVFVAPAAAPSADVVWSVRRQGGAAIVRAENRGNSRLLVTALGFNARGEEPGEPAHAVKARKAVLAQSWREWTIQVPSGAPLNALLVQMGRSDDFQSVPFSQ